MKRKIIIGIVVLAAVTFVSGASILAFASPGSQDDPFVTRDYLTGIFQPQVMADVSGIEQDLSQSFDSRISDLEAKLQSSQNSSAPATPNAADRFSVVTLNKGQSLTCSVGAEIMLRIGAASGAGSAPALVNYTTGETISSGAALIVNNMYLVTIEGNGVKATADTVRVLVRGSYKIT